MAGPAPIPPPELRNTYDVAAAIQREGEYITLLADVRKFLGSIPVSDGRPRMRQRRLLQRLDALIGGESNG